MATPTKLTGVTIAQLPAVTELQDGDVLEIDRAGKSYKISFQDLSRGLGLASFISQAESLIGL